LEFLDCLQEISNSASSRQLSLWVGAGISRDPPSALPLANELKSFLLSEICQDGTLGDFHQQRLLNGKDIGETLGKYPLEAFIESLSTSHDVLSMMSAVFSSGSPNKNHFLLARLAKGGLVSEILTTNFDLLIERALEQLGCAKGKDFEVHITEADFLQRSFHCRIALSKIHGSAHDKESMRITLSQVSSQRLATGRIEALKRFLCQGEGDVLVMGYSASDDFDINPALSAMKPAKRIFLVRHSPGMQSIGPLPSPFDNFRGVTVSCATGRILANLGRLST
jgi:hypothetical protein